MFGKGKEKEFYNKMIMLLTIFILLIVATTYGIINSKLVKIEKATQMQYSQIGGEENYELFLEISNLQKDQTTVQMESYLADLKAQNEKAAGNQANEQSIDITDIIENGGDSVEVGPEGIK